MSETSLSYRDFCATLPESVTSDQERLLSVCKAAKVEVPLEDRFYVKNHTPKKSRFNADPQPTDYVVIPHPKGGRDFWVEKSDFPALIAAASTFSGTLSE